MKSFKDFNKNNKNLEISKYSLNDAISYAQAQFNHYGNDLYDVIPNFDKNYEFAQIHASTGHHVRKDMPVIHKADISKFKTFLEDHGIKVKMKKIEVGKFHPLQKQIYINKSIDAVAQFGLKKTMDYLTNPKVVSIISNDFYIIDGHHRMLTGMLINPKIKLNSMYVDVPHLELLEMALTFSDKVGNVRNEMYLTKRRKERMFWGGEPKKYKNLSPIIAYELLHKLSKYYHEAIAMGQYDRGNFKKYSEKLSKELAKNHKIDSNEMPILSMGEFEDISQPVRR